MDLFNRVTAQLNELLRALSPTGRMLTAAVLAVIVGGGVYLVSLQTRSNFIYLLGGHSFSISELHAVQAAFGQAGLKDFEIHGAQIKIPADQLDIYLAAMADADVLPADFGDYLLQTIEKQSPLSGSRLHDQAIMAARERVLSNAVGKMKGVDTAQVFVSVLDKQGFRGQRLITASVDVKMLGDQRLDSRRVRAIRSLVAGGTAGLKRNQITVVDSNAGRDFPGADSDEPTTLEDLLLARQETLEERYEDAILGLLTYVPDAMVRVHVELTDQTSAASDQPPVTSVASVQLPAPSFANSRARLASSHESDGAAEQIQVLTPDRLDTRQPPTSNERLTPTRVTASITIPGKYFEGLWRKAHPNHSMSLAPDVTSLTALRDAECRKIQRHVLTVIPYQPGADPNELVSVASFEQLAPTGAPVVSQAHGIENWFAQNWRPLGLLTLAAGVLARWWSKSRIPVRPTPAAPHEPLVEEPNIAGTIAGLTQPRRRDDVQSSLREELARTVRDNPDAAAKILRNWIGNAS